MDTVRESLPNFFRPAEKKLRLFPACNNRNSLLFASLPSVLLCLPPHHDHCQLLGILEAAGRLFLYIPPHSAVPLSRVIAACFLSAFELFAAAAAAKEDAPSIPPFSSALFRTLCALSERGSLTQLSDQVSLLNKIVLFQYQPRDYTVSRMITACGRRNIFLERRA